MTNLTVIDNEGIEHQVTAPAGVTLMEVLRDQELGVMALCGGMCSCATCHVYIDQQWVDKLPDAHSDETALLADIPDRQPNSRLSCQIRVLPAYAGLKVTVAPDS